MVWTKNKPTVPGYYWLKMTDTEFSIQPPRVVLVAPHPDEPDDELWALEAQDDYNDGILVSDMDEDFDWSSEPISLPIVAGSCGCKQFNGNSACSSCG